VDEDRYEGEWIDEELAKHVIKFSFDEIMYIGAQWQKIKEKRRGEIIFV
jgi:hypothetical protein